MNLLDEMIAHKNKVIHKIINTPNNPDYYLVPKIIKTLVCQDSDLIPKIPNAGMVFSDNSGSYQLMHNGIKIINESYCGRWMSDVIQGFRGHHEPQEEKVFHEVLKTMPPKALMIEVGSYWAYYSMWFAKAIPEARNYLIEPGHGRLELGKKHFMLNQLKGHFTQGYIKDPVNDDDCRMAKRIEIDSFLEENQIEHVNILHADMQGYEHDMLQSAAQSVREKKIDYFFISTHGSQVHQQCHDFLVSHDYKIIAEHSNEEGYMPDGLIAAKRNGVIGPEDVPISKSKNLIW